MSFGKKLSLGSIAIAVVHFLDPRLEPASVIEILGAITRRLLGREGWFTFFSMGEWSKQRLIESLLFERPHGRPVL